MKDLKSNIVKQAEKLYQRALAFREDQRGAAAVEFAFIAPLLVATYFGTVEISRAYIIQNKVEAITETVSDLVTQGKAITTTQLQDIFKISSKTLLATEEEKFNIVVTAVRTEPDDDGDPKTEVRWSESKDGTKTHSVGSEYTDLPEGITRNYETIIVTELYYKHKSTFEVIVKGEKKFDRHFISKPRYSSDIPCSDC